MFFKIFCQAADGAPPLLNREGSGRRVVFNGRPGRFKFGGAPYTFSFDSATQPECKRYRFYLLKTTL